MNVLIFSSLNRNYMPIDCWLEGFSGDLFLFIREEHEGTYNCIKGKDNIHLYSFSNWETNWEIEKTAIDLHKDHQFDRIIALRESDLLRVAKLRDYLDVEGQRELSATLFRNKYLMKNHLRNNGIKVPNFTLIEGYTDIVLFIEENGYPVVIKPVDGAGSINTFVIKNENDLRSVLQRCSVKGFIIESFVEGDVYHIDGIIINNDIKFTTPSKYVNNCLAYQDGLSTSSIFLTNDHPLYTDLINYAKKILSAMPCPESMTFHLEVFFTPNGEIVFCEIASRTGGGRIAEGLEQEFGFHITKELIRYQCGLETSLMDHSGIFKWKKNRGWLLSSPKKGKLLAVPENIPFPWVTDYIRFARIGTEFNDVNSSVFATAAFICEADNDHELIDRLLKLDKWYKMNCKYELITNPKECN